MKSWCLLAATTAALMACAPDSPISPEVSGPADIASLLGARRDRAQGPRSRGIEDEILSLDEEVGGVGGVYIDGGGALVVNVTGEGRAAAVVKALNSQSLARRHLGSRARRNANSIRFNRVDYRFTELVGIQTKIRPIVERIPGVIFTDADEKFSQVRIGVSDSTVLHGVAASLQANGFPSGAFRYVIANRPNSIASIRDKFRPTGAGIQILVRHNILLNKWKVCTLGFNVTDSLGTRYALTARHCIKPEYQTGSQNYVSNPTNGSSSRWIGHASAYAPNVSDPGCEGVGECMNSDAMLIKYDDNVLSPKRIIHTSSSGGPFAAGTLNRSSGDVWDVVDSMYTPAVGDTIHKIGRTTGWTHGPVVDSCVDFLPSEGKVVLCSDVIVAYADSGDSGGPAFYHDITLPSNVRVPAGIVWGIIDMYYYPIAAGPGIWARHLIISNREQIKIDLGTLSY